MMQCRVCRTVVLKRSERLDKGEHQPRTFNGGFTVPTSKEPGKPWTPSYVSKELPSLHPTSGPCSSSNNPVEHLDKTAERSRDWESRPHCMIQLRFIVRDRSLTRYIFRRVHSLFAEHLIFSPCLRILLFAIAQSIK